MLIYIYKYCSANQTQPNEPSDQDLALIGEDDEVTKGYFINISDIDATKFSYYLEKERFIVTYQHSKQFFVKSGEFTGEFKVFPSNIANAGPCIYIKKNEVIESLKEQISKLLGKLVKFYGKNDKNSLLGCFIDITRNMDNALCVNALVNGEPELVPVEKLFGRVGKLSAVLRSGPVKKSKGDLFWSLSVTQIKIDDIPADQIGYYKRAEPLIRFQM